MDIHDRDERGVRFGGLRPASLARGAAVLLALAGAAVAANDPPVEEIWEDERLAEAYLDFEVSLGNNGSMAFSDTGLLDAYTRLYTSVRGTGASPVIWERSRNFLATYARSVDSADLADVHAVVRHEGNVTLERTTYLEVFRSSSSTPVLSYAFNTGDIGNGFNWCRVTPDGSTVLACASNGSTTWVRRFDANSSGPGFHPAGAWTVTTFGAPESHGISNDLRLLYLGNVSEARVIDLFTGATIFQTFLIGGASATGHAFSPDGRRIAIPAGDRVRMFRTNGSTYAEESPLGSPSPSGNQVAQQATFSADGSTLAASFYVTGSYDEVSVAAWNLDGPNSSHPNPISVLGKRYFSNGQFANVPTDLMLSGDGMRLAMSMRGPVQGSVPGIAVFSRDSFEGQSGQATPFQEFHNLYRDGSVYNLDLSPDGSRIALARRRGYPGTGFGEKIIEAVDLGKEFAARGDARVGGSVVFEYYPDLTGAESSTPPCFLLSAGSLESPPKVFSGVGTLYVLRSDIVPVYMGTPDSTGKVTSAPFRIRLFSANDNTPEIVGPVGSTRYFQALRTSTRRLSDA